MKSSWADRIKDLEAWGWSLTAIAGAIGLSPQGVSDIKQGRTKAPTGDSAVLLHSLHAGGMQLASVMAAEQKLLAVEQATGISRHELRPDIFGPAPAEKTEAA